MVTEGRKPHLPRRRANIRKERPKILIACEGEKTEPNYFRSFRVADVLEIIKAAGNTCGVVEAALEHVRSKGPKYYSSVWAVFDRDGFPPERIQTAFRLAEKHGVRVAFSNEAFELWYILHFGYRDTGMSRAEYQERLSDLLGCRYQKNDLDMYNRLRGRMPDAVRNAAKLCAQYAGKTGMHDRNPYTSVHELAVFLENASKA